MRPLPPASIHHITDPHAVYLVQRLFVQIRSLKKEMDALYRAVQGGLDSCGTGATLPERGICQGVQQENSTDATQNCHQTAGLHGNPTLVQRLRDWRKVHLASLHLLMEEAADEMERLRLTDAEREAVLAMACHCDTRSGLEWVRLSATLRGLLERLAPTTAEQTKIK